MPIQSSFPKVAEQVLTLNKNVVDILSKLSEVTTSTKESVQVSLVDENGIPRTYSLPTISSLRSEIRRLDSNIKTMYNIDTTGSLVQTSPGNFKKVVAVDLNRDPAPIATLGAVTQFKATNNWFFDAMLNPMLSVEMDLGFQIEDNVRKILIRRYIVEFERDATGNLTAIGQSALNSFNSLYKSSTINITDFEAWHKSTPGVLDGQNPKIDEQIFELEPNELQFLGEFSVSQPVEDTVNRKLWYPLNTLDYVDNSTGSVKKLDVGNELIVNIAKSTTRYQVIEVNTSFDLPRVRLQIVEGLDPIPQGVGTLKIYSPVITSKKVRVSIGYNERNVVFAKAINVDSHIMSKEWSAGTGFYTNDLTLNSTVNNGTSMEQFYTEFVYDYGVVLKDMVTKNIPNSLAGTPAVPAVLASNFIVEQINKHITDTTSSKSLTDKYNSQQTLKSQVEQIQKAITEQTKLASNNPTATFSEKQAANNAIKKLQLDLQSKQNLLNTVTQQIRELSNNPLSKVDPEFAIRGYWPYPSATVVNGTRAQEVVQFEVQYRYLGMDGKENASSKFTIGDTQKTGVWPSWHTMKTEVREYTFNPSTGGYEWASVDESSTEKMNNNKLEIPIKPNEQVEFRIRSISEVGWPNSPVYSDWSESVTVQFPTDLINVINQNQTIANEANREDLMNTVMGNLQANGLNDFLSRRRQIGDKTYLMEAKDLLSGFFDNNVALDLFEYISSLNERIRKLEEKIQKAKGELRVVVVDQFGNEITVNNNSDTRFVVECEDYMLGYNSTNVSTDRVYHNYIYAIDKFVVKLKNVSADSPLGLLSSRTYDSKNTDVYNDKAPQVFWLDLNGNIITLDSTTTKTQTDHQFFWSVNYETVTSNTVTRLSDNIGNLFVSNGNNSLVKVLASETYNIGFNDTKALSFVDNNKALTDPAKWRDTDENIASKTKLLTTVHPVQASLTNIVEDNNEKIKSVGSGKEVIIPIKIYFKMNSLDNTRSGPDFEYVELTNSQATVTHTKKVRFMVEDDNSSVPFKFTVTFVINRSRVGYTKNSI